MSDLRNVPGIGAKKEAELIALGYPTLEALKELPVRQVVLKPELDIIEGYMKEQLTH